MSPSSGDALVCCVKKGRYQRLHGITLVPPNNYTTAWFYEVVGQALVFWLPSARLQFTTTERALRNLAPIWPPVGLYWILPQPLARTTKLLCAFQPVLFPLCAGLPPAPICFLSHSDIVWAAPVFSPLQARWYAGVLTQTVRKSDGKIYSQSRTSRLKRR